MQRIFSRLRFGQLRTAANHQPNSSATPPRAFRILPDRQFSLSPVSLQKKMISVTFVNREGTQVTVKAKVGDSFLDAAVNNDVDLEGFGACEGTLSCSTCHIIFKKEDFDKLPDKPSDEEMDMLDLAYGLTDTSRLGCQITLTESMDGIVVQVPAQVADARNR